MKARIQQESCVPDDRVVHRHNPLVIVKDGVQKVPSIWFGRDPVDLIVDLGQGLGKLSIQPN
jgi:hypothetical protein